MSMTKLLSEAVDKDVLYHFTLSTNFLKISKDNKLKKKQGIVSLTRKFNFSNEWEHFGDVRIALDKRLLSNNYKIKPFNWVAYRTKDSYYGYEDEEMVNSDIRNLNKYIVQIDINQTFHKGYISNIKFETIISQLKNRYSIPINVVSKWEPIR